MFNDLSEIQKMKYKSICGYDYVPGSFTGKFLTAAPYDNHEWKLSPWSFSFQFDRETGFLFSYMFHRMTNDQAYGWDHEGNELDGKTVEKVFNPHFSLADFMRPIKN